jgi:hypothetical protein
MYVNREVSVTKAGITADIELNYSFVKVYRLKKTAYRLKHITV